MKINRMFFVAFLAFVPPLSAYQHPYVAYTIQGVVQDWATKAPLLDAQILVFLNDLNYGDNPGHVGTYDYPHLPRSGPKGEFQGRARFPGTDIKKVEVIAFCKGYRTERFIFNDSEFKLKKVKVRSYIVEVPSITLLKTSNQPNQALQPTPHTARCG